MIFCLEKCKYQKDGECQKQDTLTNTVISELNCVNCTSACCHFVPCDGYDSKPKDLEQIKN